ncbi:uncharacterized protein PgNI_07527 [Pyricularia grisea]|uniref:Uncharacterized protein n=1 Tax=Pyricularia grisea TaxID=148305 RepID=A0A6P8B0G0_PYRGI|nr:uncharacterized protein PgNI_07527 [Pyricularia grisea]TLD08400.1 hypothetical protein PgNI_07527 [Pyricularia grisea]
MEVSADQSVQLPITTFESNVVGPRAISIPTVVGLFFGSGSKLSLFDAGTRCRRIPALVFEMGQIRRFTALANVVVTETS